MCLSDAKQAARISLAQRLIAYYNSFSMQLVVNISKHVKPDQPADANQLDQLTDHMISLCDGNEGAEPLLVDCIVSLLCSEGEMSRLILLAKVCPVPEKPISVYMYMYLFFVLITNSHLTLLVVENV